MPTAARSRPLPSGAGNLVRHPPVALTDEHVAHVAHDAVLHATERELHR